ncbi:uncharacterized protein A4U43_C09F9440 [Asparagus officinalis]|uniref:Uncharacterized protein n=1 Tax=Asparagus officinalis TaxID=4686 RepID=A0A5P1E6W6_ASPOF|nr:uncharacterized protein A4U43_C09F9440 [Asparagus officinalis]
MEPRHFAAYEDSVFRYYVHFSPPGVDLPTFKHILSQWDKKRKKFVFTDRNDGEEIACSFNLEWVMPQDIDEDAEHPNEGVEKMEMPQQVIYWKSIASMNQALRRENENKFKDTLIEDTRKEIKQSENAPPPAPDTSTEDEDAPLRFSKDLNKRKRGAKEAREKVSAATLLKGKRCRRAVKPSKWVVTPYIEGKKKKEKDNIGDKAIVEVAGEKGEQV